MGRNCQPISYLICLKILINLILIGAGLLGKILRLLKGVIREKAQAGKGLNRVHERNFSQF